MSPTTVVTMGIAVGALMIAVVTWVRESRAAQREAEGRSLVKRYVTIAVGWQMRHDALADRIAILEEADRKRSLAGAYRGRLS